MSASGSREADWVPSNHALMQATARLGGERARAMDALRREAATGSIRTKASLFQNLEGEVRDAALSPEFWTGDRGLLSAARPICAEDWEAGSFEGRGAGMQSCKASGVAFNSADLARRFPPSLDFTPKVGTAKGGRPKKQDAWDRFWLAVLTLQTEGRLHAGQFQSQRELMDEILAMIDHCLSEGAVRGKVRQVWDQFVERRTAAA